LYELLDPTTYHQYDGLFAPSFVNYKKGALKSQLQVIKDNQLLAQSRWFSTASSTTKTGCHDIAEILLKVALNTTNQINHSLQDL
jgi:hypothetical protein